MPRKLVALLSWLLVCSPVAAQQSTTRGFALGGSLFGATLDPEDGDDHSGGGLGIELSYGFGSGLSLFLNGAGASMSPDDDDAGETYTLGQGELGVRWHFLGAGQRWRPFVEGALGSVHAEFEDVPFLGQDRDVTVTGPAFTLGGGMSYYLNPAWSLGLGVRWSTASLDEIKVDNVTVELGDDEEYDLRTTRLELRLTHFFSGN